MKMNIHRYLRTAAVLLAAGGLGFGLVGAGVRASWSDSASATENIKVGTFGITVTSAQGVVVNAGNGVHTVTYDAGTILSSAAGTAPLAFTVTSTGSIPVLIHVAKGTAPASPFFDMMATAPADVTLTIGLHQDYSGGIGWAELGNANMGQAASVIYTITASA